MRGKKRILVIAPNTWSFQELERRGAEFELVFVENQFQKEKLSFWDQLRLAVGLNFTKGVHKVVRLARKHRVDGVLGADDFISCLYASAAARELGLPGARTELELTFQHKYYSRVLQRRLVPEYVPNFGVLNLKSPPPFPFFVKPIRGSASMMAMRIESESDLVKYQRLPLLRRLFLSRVLSTFEGIAAEFAGLEKLGSPVVFEELIDGRQCTLEGIVYRGQHKIVGVVDSVMYPHSRLSFSQFDFPSQLPPSVQNRMHEVARKLIEKSGFDFGFYNIEFFYVRDSDEIKIIEVNPRMAFQFTDLYEKVLGVNTFDLLLQMTVGADLDLDEIFSRRTGKFSMASSFVKRVFADGMVVKSPSLADAKSLEKGAADARILLQAKQGTRLSSDIFQDMESFRLMTVNVGASSRDGLESAYRKVDDRLRFEIQFDEIVAETGTETFRGEEKWKRA